MARLLHYAVSLTVAFAPAYALAQDDRDLQERVNQVQEQYEEALTGGDVDALLDLFSDDAVYWPLTGGKIEGTEALRNHFEQGPPPSELDITSTDTETIGDVVVDIGTFTITMPEEAGGEVQGEYVVLAEDTDDGVRIRRLFSAPVRRAPDGAQ